MGSVKVTPGIRAIRFAAGCVEDYTRRKMNRCIDDQATQTLYLREGSADMDKAAKRARLQVVVGCFHDGCLEIEREITSGSHIGWQDMRWHVFKSCGCSVNAGAATLYDLILSMAPNEKVEAPKL
jgi:hypothetical protein